MSVAVGETIPLATLMHETNEKNPLNLPSPKFIIKVLKNDQSCVAMAENPQLIPRTKHIAMKYHHFWKHVITQANPNGFIQLEYCSTNDQIPDLFTKLSEILGPRSAIHVNHLQVPCRAFFRWDLSWGEMLILLIPTLILHVFGSRLFPVVGCNMVLCRNKHNLLGLMVLDKW